MIPCLSGKVQLLEVLSNLRFELGAFCELFLELRRQPLHLLVKRFAVILNFLGANVTARRENVAVRGDLFGGGVLAEAGGILVLARTFLAPPRMVGLGDPLGFLV